MEQKSKYIEFSEEADSVCLELDDNSKVWHTPTDKVKKFIGRIEEGSEVVFSLDRDNNLSFIQGAENGVPKKAIKQEKLAQNGNEYDRLAALKNATNLVIAKGGDQVREQNVLEIANKFLEFLEAA
jgi:hypothetical protein